MSTNLGAYQTLYLQGELEENFYLDLENNLAGFMRSPGAIVWFESVRDYFPQETNEMFEMLQKKYDGKATMLEYFQFTPS